MVMWQVILISIIVSLVVKIIFEHHLNKPSNKFESSLNIKQFKEDIKTTESYLGHVLRDVDLTDKQKEKINKNVIELTSHANRLSKAE